MYLSQNVSCYVFCCSVAQSCLTLCDLMDCSMPDFPVLPYLLELAQTHVHWVGDAIQPSHPLLSPSPAFNLSQHQGLFQCVSSLHMWPKYWSFSFSMSPSNVYSGFISFGIDCVWSPCCLRDSQECSSTPQFEGIHSAVLSHVLVTPWENTFLWKLWF